MKNIKNIALSLVCVGVLAACGGSDKKVAAPVDNSQGNGQTTGQQTEVVHPTATFESVVSANANYAFAVYSDALSSAKSLQEAINTFVATPSEANFMLAKQAWLNSREPYGQSEVFRFREGPIDALTKDEQGNWTLQDGQGPEGAINAWPLAEALIDYTQDMDGNEARGNAAVYQSGGNIIQDSFTFAQITADLIREKFELDGEEANVTSGYHAIEFLLWGQDLNADLTYTAQRDYTAGHRPVTDYYTSSNLPSSEANGRTCTSGEQGAQDEICQRRGDYLKAAAALLVQDLQAVVDAWHPETGFHYQEYTKADNAAANLGAMLESMGRLSFGELAGERMSIAVRTDSQEDEHSCFSDNTHRDIFLNAKGIRNTYLGLYTDINGLEQSGPSIHNLLVTKGHEALALKLKTALDNTMAKVLIIDQTAKAGMSFDVQIQKAENQAHIYAAITALAEQTDLIQEAIDALGVSAEDLKQDTEENI
ncbi:insulin-cleaving metalloproteinase outer membrane protein [Pseudoalteromonas sp. A25]|uniref:imelysin family protein n=1 Tax=Pseudoalteromonas sp. A25 TaxID=116092 RepID=UPI001260F04B|nr:imelysin family protein [Pseudoalteromonas sp. A25]BBN83445.1 insulin-cleaving metalloproteinase outer membrane protein [Pseudoalteromonas sp. A25]